MMFAGLKLEPLSSRLAMAAARAECRTAIQSVLELGGQRLMDHRGS